MAKDNFQERKQNRIEYHERKAIQTEKESEAAYKTAKDIGSAIPFGQPILVGHHSEKRHRAAIKKIDNSMRKCVDLGKKSEYHERKAEHIKSDTAIYSDDPEAVTKLKEKIAGLEKNQSFMKAANKIVKSKKLAEAEKIEKLVEMGLKERQALEIMGPDYAGRIGFASYALSNNNANIRTAKKRLERLAAAAKMEHKEYEVKDGISIVENVEANRVQIIFPGKPDADVRAKLKSNGFRWSPRFGAWQRHLNAWGIRIARDLVDTL